MTKNELRRRMTRIKATPLPPKVEPVNNNRRGNNYVDMNMEENLSHDNFFEFEKDLVELQSSRSLAASAHGAHDFFATGDIMATKPVIAAPSYMVMDDRPEEIVPPASGIMLDEIEEEETNIESIGEGVITAKEVNFKFIQCGAIKSNGERCKRQAPKGFETCSIPAHRKQNSSINKEEKDESR
jgi:hypothetical protein